MTDRRSTNKSKVIISLCVMSLLVIGLFNYQRYPLNYIYRVVAYQDSDFDDIEVFPATPIAGSSHPMVWPISYSNEAVHTVNQLTGADSLVSFMEETETSAFLIARNGTLVVEEYALGHSAISMQNSFSVSKSMISAVTGIAVRDGLLSLSDPVTGYVPELLENDERFIDIKIEDLLGMRSGIRYSSNSDFPFINRDDPLIYYHPDLEFVILDRLQIEQPPGEFEYNNYNPPLLGLILRRVNEQSVSAIVQRELWEPIGATADAGWTTDNAGMERMESGFFTTARGLAKLGQLYLDGGRAGNTQVLPPEWVRQTTELKNPEFVTDADYNGRTWGYGLGWWVVPRPEGRSDFTGIGRYGQFVYVSPQHNVVIVRTGPGRGDWGDRDWTQLFFEVSGQL